MKYLRTIIAVFLLALPQTGAFWIGQASSTATQGWQLLKIGGAGYVPKLDIAPSDNTAIITRDQGGCSIQTTSASTPLWTDLVTTASMPAGTIVTSSGGPQGVGCDEAVSDHGNTNYIWVEYLGGLYISSNKGVSFTSVTGGSGYPAQPIVLGAMKNQDIKQVGPLVAIDPNNPDVGYASTPAAGLYFTSNATSTATFSQITAVAAGLSPAATSTTSTTSRTIGSSPCTVGSTSCQFTTASSESWPTGGGYIQVYETSNPANQIFGAVDSASSGTSLTIDVAAVQGSGTHTDWTVSTIYANGQNNISFAGHVIAFDTSHGTTSVSSQTRTAYVYVCTFGIGIFQSTNGGQTWSSLTGGPTDCYNMVVDPNGVLWFVAYTGANQVWTYTPGTGWKQLTGIAPYNGDAQSIAVDPNSCATESTCSVAVASGGLIYYTATGGTGSGGNQGNGWSLVQSFSWSSSDIGWAAAWQDNFGFFGVGGIRFDGSHRLFWSDEFVFYGTPTIGMSTFALTSQTAGEEEIEGLSIAQPVGSSNIIALGWDVGCFLTTSPSTYSAAQSCYGPNADGFRHGYVVNSNGANVVALIDNQYQGDVYTSYTGYSTNYGTSWTACTPPSAVSSNHDYGGSIAIDTSGNDILWAPADGVSGIVAPYYTTNNCSSWTQISVSGVTEGWPFNYQDGFQSVTSDQVNAGTFYIYNYNTGSGADAIIKCTGGGASCAKQSSPGFGPNNQYKPSLKAFPGHAGYLLFCYGIPLSPVPNNSYQGLYYWPDSGVTLNTIANFSGVTACGLGGAASGHTFPTIWAAGWYNNAYGIWRCENFDGDQCGSSGDWVNEGGGYPNGWPYGVFDLVGDSSGPNKVYGVTSSGAFWGQFNYLLARDLNPANDNSPAFLNMVG